MRKIFILGLLCYTTLAQAGVVIGGTRFVYGESARAISISVFNKSPSTALIETRVTPGGTWPGVTSSSEDTVPFIATPPLFALAARHENKIRLVLLDNSLPKDRESLFTLSIAAIPSGKEENNSVQVAVRSRLKLFYRPSGLKGDPQQAYQRLRWNITSSGLVVNNPTPWYVTLFNLHVAGEEVDNAGVVAPFSQRQTEWCRGRPTCSVRWQTLNDYGRVMPPAALTVTGRAK